MKYNTNFLKRLDAFSKPLEDLRIKTLSGAFVTIISTLLIIVLFIGEFREYMQPETNQELFVDTMRGQKMKINIDIIFVRLACEYMGLDAMDVSGEQQIDIAHDIYKVRLDLDGNPISEAMKHDVTPIHKKTDEVKPVVNETGVAREKCGSCYGAENSVLKCCNTCADVREAYRAKGWAFSSPTAISQCMDEGWEDKMKQAAHEGCRLSGHLFVNKVAGNFHFAPGKSFTQSHVHVHDVQSFGQTQFNISHKIVRLSFGDDYPGVANPLDNVEAIIEQHSQMYTYYTKIVPTSYHSLNGSQLRTNQYSVTKHMKATALSGGSDGLPGVFFSYEISPMLVKISEKQKSFMQFLTSACAIIGGVFTVSSLIDAFIYNSSRVIREKLVAGKLS